MSLNRPRHRGQAIVMVTLSLFVIFGIIGLAVDLGWAYFVEKSAQTAADAAAIAAVKKAFDDADSITDFRCSGGVVECSATPIECPAAEGNLQSACIYAAQNGFSATDPRRHVTVVASDSVTPPTVTGCTPSVTHPPTAPCVDVEYWVTVRVTESIPQLFSAILGNGLATVSARATAAVAQSEVIGSLILINRENDASPVTGVGTNLKNWGGPHVYVPGGILLASGDDEAGAIGGTGDVESPFTYIRTGGDYSITGGATWTAEPQNRADGGMFQDPMRGKGQPPITPTTNYIPVPGGTLTTAQCPGGLCPPGNYYATTTTKDGLTFASGERIRIPVVKDPQDPKRNLTFQFAGGSFDDYVFFGGLLIDAATVDFGPGRYVLAGVKDLDTKVFETVNNVWVTGGTSETSDAGRLFILTDSDYAGQLTAAASGIPVQKDWGGPRLKFGSAAFKSGNNENSSITLYGLNPTSSSLPEDLKTFGPVVIWQDQQNSYVDYTASGQINVSCTGATLNDPCKNTPDSAMAPRLELGANQWSTFGGVVYQPRGAWTHIQAAGDYEGPLRIITGAMDLQGSGTLTLTSPSVPVTQLTTALIE